MIETSTGTRGSEGTITNYERSQFNRSSDKNQSNMNTTRKLAKADATLIRTLKTPFNRNNGAKTLENQDKMKTNSLPTHN